MEQGRKCEVKQERFLPVAKLAHPSLQLPARELRKEELLCFNPFSRKRVTTLQRHEWTMDNVGQERLEKQELSAGASFEYPAIDVGGRSKQCRRRLTLIAKSLT